MPQRLDEFLGAPATPAPTAPQGMRLDQFLAGAAPATTPNASIPASPAAYFQTHQGMDPLAVENAYAQLKNPTGPARVTTPEMIVRQQAQAANTQRGTIGNFLAGAGENITGLEGRALKIAAGVEDFAGAHNFAANTRLAAERAEDTRPQEGSIAGTVGQVAGSLPFAFTGPLGAAASAVNTGEQTYHGIEEARDNGANIGTGQAATDVIAQTVLNYALNRVGQKNITGGLAPSLVKKLLPELQGVAKQAIARVGAAIPIEAGIGGVQQLISNAITKATGVNPDQDLTEGVKRAAAVNAVVGGAGRTLHEAAPVVSPFLSRLRNKVTGEPAAPGVNPTGGDQASGQAQGDQSALHESLPPNGVVNREGVNATEQPVHAAEKDVHAATRSDLEPVSPEASHEPDNRPAAAPAEEPVQHPERLDNSEAVGKWYGDTFKDPENAAVMQAMASMHEGKYALADVPIENARNLNGMTGDMDMNKVAAISKLSPEEQAKLPPGVALPSDKGVDFVDGNHRLEGLRAAGAKTVRAYVPESTIGKNGIVEAAQTKTNPDVQTAPKLFGARKGAVALPSREDITGPGSIYHEELKKPLSGLANIVKWATGTAKSAFPMETGAGSKAAADTFRGRFGESANNYHRAEVAFEDGRKAFGKMDVADQHEFQRRMYNQEPQTTPELQQIADAMYKDTNEGRQKLVALGNKAAETWDEQKWNMLWKKDAAKAEALQTNANRPGKIEGKAGFLKKKSLSEFDDGLAQGLVPKHDNPVDMFLATKMEREKYLAGYAGMKDLTTAGSIRRFADPKQVPDGWVEVPGGAKGVLKNIIAGDGNAYAPEPVARILKNIVTPSAIGNNPIYQALQASNNVATQALLGLSAFHLRKVTQEAINLKTAQALDMAVQGQAGAGKVLGRSLLAPKDAIVKGGDVQKIMLGMKHASPVEAQTTADMVQGGFRAKGDSAYETQFGRKFQKAVSDGGLQGMIRASAYAAPAANETLMQKGVFGYVQKAKMHVGYELTKNWREKFTADNSRPPTTAEVRSEVGKISDHVDNVLGLMVRDNLFWNRTARDLATLGTLSVGWNYGSARELGGGVVDLGKGIGTLAKGGKMSDVDTKRISYLATTAALTGITGAATTYMLTGHAPKTLRDYIFPPTGAKDREGHDTRLNTGFYTTDYFDFFHDPVGTLKAKGSPLLHAASDLIANKDFQGTQIRNGDDAWYKQAGDVAKYLGKSMTPLSISQLHNTITGGGTSGQSKGLQIAGLLGIKTAPKSLSESDAETEAHGILNGKLPAMGRTPEEAAKTQKVHELANEIRDKAPAAWKDIRQAVKDGLIKNEDVDRIKKRAEAPLGLQGLLKNTELHPEDLMKVWGKMTPEERQTNQWVVRGRIGRSDKTPAEKTQMFSRIAKDVREAVGAK